MGNVADIAGSEIAYTSQAAAEDRCGNSDTVWRQHEVSWKHKPRIQDRPMVRRKIQIAISRKSPDFRSSGEQPEQ